MRNAFENNAPLLIIILLLVATALVIPAWTQSRSLSRLLNPKPDRFGLTLRKQLTLTPDRARALVQQGCDLNLDALETISPDVATELAANVGSLSFSGLTTLSLEATEALAKHQGSLSLGRRIHRTLDDDSPCDFLASLTEAQMAALASHKGDLWLRGLTQLKEPQAEALAQHKGSLSLGNLTELSDEAAKALAQHNGNLFLNDLTTLSDDAAKALAQHKGRLFLPYLTTLSDEAAQALRANPSIFLPQKFRKYCSAERETRAANRGRWADKTPVPLWGWRAREKDRKRVPAGRYRDSFVIYHVVVVTRDERRR